MKTKYFIILLFVSLIDMNLYCQQNFTGSWTSSNSTSDFTLTLNQSNNYISGCHCSIFNNGSKMDCSDDNTITLTGNIVNNNITANFISCYSNKSGTASIKPLNSNCIEWEITQEPNGEYYIPQKIKLFKNQVGGFTMNSGFSDISSTVSNYGIDATMSLMFYSSSDMILGVSYIVTTISENLRPSVTRSLSTTVNGKTWDITVNSDGKVYCQISTGANLTANSTINLSSLTYKLYDLE